MKYSIRNVLGMGKNDEEYTGLFINFIEEWSQFFCECNWRTFHPVFWEIEDDRMMGGVEMTLIIMGVGFRARYNYKRTERVDEINVSVTEMMDKLGLSD